MDSIARKSLLYRTAVEYGDYTVNHVEGCAHGCRYPCYAMQMSKRYGRIRSYDEWTRPKLVSNALELLKRELPKHRDKIRFVHLCFMSDPFMMGFPEVSKMSLAIMKLVNEAGIRVTTLTKGVYPENLLDKITNTGNEYGITLVSVKPGHQRNFEPNTAKWFRRVRSLERLSRLGAKTWVSIEPYPTPNIVRQDIHEVLDRVAFTDKIVFGRLNYNLKSTQYREHRSYYNELCDQVVEFCDKSGIDYHIKTGTRTGSIS